MSLDTDQEASYVLCFRDARTPYEVQVELERRIETLFKPSYDAKLLVWRGRTTSQGIPYSFELRFDAALSDSNCYMVSMLARWTTIPTPPSRFRESSKSWFEFYTGAFKAAPPCDPGRGSAERYRLLAEQALFAESQLTDVAAIQQEILARMRKGERFSTSHKEGGTDLFCESSFWRKGSSFVRQEYGETNGREVLTEAKFLQFLRQFYDWKTSQHAYPEKAQEFDAWKLILRQLRKR